MPTAAFLLFLDLFLRFVGKFSLLLLPPHIDVGLIGEHPWLLVRRSSLQAADGKALALLPSLDSPFRPGKMFGDGFPAVEKVVRLRSRAFRTQGMISFHLW